MRLTAHFIIAIDYVASNDRRTAILACEVVDITYLKVLTQHSPKGIRTRVLPNTPVC